MAEIDVKLKKLRNLFGYSQAAVAFAIKVSQSTYSRYENGISTPGINQVESVIKLYGICLSEFVESDTKILLQSVVTREVFLNRACL